MAAADTWASDGEVSRPAAPRPEAPAILDFGGFAFGSGGMVFPISEVDADEIFTPTFAPGQ